MAMINNERKVGTRFAIVLEVQKPPLDLYGAGGLCIGCIFKTPNGCRNLGIFGAGYCASVVRKTYNDEVIFKAVGVMELDDDKKNQMEKQWNGK